MKLHKNFTTRELGIIADSLESESEHYQIEIHGKSVMEGLMKYFNDKWSISLDANIKEAEKNEKRN